MKTYVFKDHSLKPGVLLPVSAPALAHDDLARQSQNPIGNMISLPMQNNTYFGVGPSEEWTNSFQLQVKLLFP